MTAAVRRVSLLSGIFRGIIVLALIVFTCNIGAFAQLSATATITGTVTDSNGALVPAATVTITDDATSVSLKTQSNGRGVYVAPDLNVATYSITIAKAGFKNYTVTGIVLHPTETVQVNGTLTVGAASETVTVGATSTDVELSSPQLSSYLSTEQVSSLPMNGRNFEGVAALAPGVVNTSQGTAIGTGGRNTSSVLVINGMTVSRTFYALDGVWNENTGNMTANSITPNPDSLAEVRVLQNDFSAQYSLMGSSVILEQTKSGTSNFHGTLWEYVRNDDLNAKNFFTTTAPLIPPYKQNIFGFNVGGPLFIPNHYNTNRQKTFFFWDESYVILHVPSQGQSWIPTPNQIAGCFASPTKDPLTGTLFPVSTGGTCPVGDYVIPSSRINTSSEAYLKDLYPAPNYSSTANTNNYVNLQPLTTYQRDDEFKIDHFFNPKYHLLAEYLQEYQNYSQNTESPGSTPIDYETDFTHNKIAQVALTQTLSPNMVNSTSVAMNIYLLNLVLEGTSDISQLPGFSETLFYPTALYASRTPVVNFTGGAASQGIQAARPIPHASDLDDTVTDNWSWLKGKNYFTAGITFVFNTKRQVSGQQTNGAFTFTDTNSAATAAQKTAANACGAAPAYNTAAQCNEDFGVADMELGYLSSFSEVSNAPHGDMHAFSWSPYAEDQFKFNKNLTLTLGLRIYHLPLPYGVPGSETNFVPSAYNPALAPTVNESSGVTNIPPNVPGYSNGLLYNNGLAGGLPRNFSSNHVWYAAPDLGFAWDVFGDGRTSLRGGFGISYTRIFTNQDCSFNCIANPPVFTSQNLTNLNFLTTPTNWNIVTAATGTGVGAKPVSVESVTMAEANIQASPVASYSLGVQHEFPRNITASIVGAGSRIQHQEANPNINVPPYYTSAAGVHYDFNPLINSNPANSGAAGDNQYYYAPYQGYGSMTDYMTPLWQEWNGLEAQIKHQVTKSLFVTAAYTWSHSTSNSTIDVHNFNRYHGNTVGLNYPDSLNISLLYQLPFFQHSGNQLEKLTMGGWSINDISTFRSGDSLDPGLSESFQGNASRPDVVPGVSTNGPKAWKTTTGVAQEWFNTAAFSCPGSTGANVGVSCGTMSAANGNFGLYGNAMTGLIRGTGQEIYNMAMFKEFHITENNYFEFRAEAFNVFNHTNPNNPNTTLGNSNYGKVTSAADPRIMELALRYRF
jgi:hypothetical protein